MAHDSGILQFPDTFLCGLGEQIVERPKPFTIIFGEGLLSLRGFRRAAPVFALREDCAVLCQPDRLMRGPSKRAA